MLVVPEGGSSLLNKLRANEGRSSSPSSDAYAGPVPLYPTGLGVVFPPVARRRGGRPADGALATMRGTPQQLRLPRGGRWRRGCPTRRRQLPTSAPMQTKQCIAVTQDISLHSFRLLGSHTEISPVRLSGLFPRPSHRNECGVARYGTMARPPPVRFADHPARLWICFVIRTPPSCNLTHLDSVGRA